MDEKEMNTKLMPEILEPKTIYFSVKPPAVGKLTSIELWQVKPIKFRMNPLAGHEVEKASKDFIERFKHSLLRRDADPKAEFGMRRIGLILLGLFAILIVALVAVVW